MQVGKRQKKTLVKPYQTWKTVLWIGQSVAECPANGDNISALPYSRVMQYFKLFCGLQYKLLNTIYNGHLVISSYHKQMHTKTVKTPYAGRES